MVSDERKRDLPDDRMAALTAQSYGIEAVNDRLGPEDMAEWKRHRA